MSTLSGAIEDTAYTLTYAALAAAADEADVNGGTILFRVEQILAGSLSKNGTAVTSGAIFGPSETLIWTPPADANGTINAFSVKAWDGALASTTAVEVPIAVAAVNDPPTLNAIYSPSPISRNAGPQNVSLGGISAGPPNESTQPVTLSAVSSNPAVIPNPTPGYTQGSNTGSLTYTPVANAVGTAVITVTVSDGQAANATVVRTFTVTVQ